MDERIYFNQHGIYVSTNRVVINEQVLPITNIVSLSFKMVEPRKWRSAFFMIFGLLLLFDGALLVIIGSYSILLGLITWISAKTCYSVTLNTKVGESKTLASNDRFRIEQLIFALNKAMSSRERPV
jgi:hypothetical protein